jgi:hypothetical protein
MCANNKLIRLNKIVSELATTSAISFIAISLAYQSLAILFSQKKISQTLIFFENKSALATSQTNKPCTSFTSLLHQTPHPTPGQAV